MTISHPKMFKKIQRDKLQWSTLAISNFNSHIKLHKTEVSKYWHQLNSQEEYEYDSTWMSKTIFTEISWNGPSRLASVTVSFLNWN